jgi:hypothetical protein
MEPRLKAVGLVTPKGEPQSGERFFRRSAALRASLIPSHGLQPWLHSAAAPRLKPAAHPRPTNGIFVAMTVMN